MGNGLMRRYRNSSVNGDIASETDLLARHQLLADNAATTLIIAGYQSRAFLQMLQQIAFS
jgi:hypothetical protein